MNNRAVILTQEEWDRLIEVLDFQHLQHPDTQYLLTRITNQLNYSPSDTPLPYPTPSHTVTIPNPTAIQVNAVADIIKNKQILKEGMEAFDNK